LLLASCYTTVVSPNPKNSIVDLNFFFQSLNLFLNAVVQFIQEAMSSLFGSLTPQQQPTSSLFSSSLQNTFSQTPAFGQTQQSAAQSSTPVFGQTQSSIFGQTSGQLTTYIISVH
jgi:hypothetical protein